MLFRDLPALASRRRLGRGSSSRSLGPNTSTTNSSMPEIEQVDVVGEGGGKEAHGRHHGSHYSDIAAAIPDQFNVNIVGETVREIAL